MLCISRDQELGLSRKSTFEDSAIIIVGGDDGEPFCRVHKPGKRANGAHASPGRSVAKAELLPQDPFELRKNKRGDEESHLPSANPIKNLVRLAPGKGKCGDQNVGVQDDSHRLSGLFANRMDESIHILFRPDPEGLGLEGSFPLEFSPAPFIEVNAQGLPNQLAFGPVFFFRRPLGLSDKRGGKRDCPRPGCAHRVILNLFRGVLLSKIDADRWYVNGEGVPISSAPGGTP